jgi:hypothetical protein
MSDKEFAAVRQGSVGTSRACVAMVAATLLVLLWLAAGARADYPYNQESMSPHPACEDGATALVTKALKDGKTDIGTAELRYSPKCGTTWVRVIFKFGSYYPDPSVWEQNQTGTDRHRATNPMDLDLNSGIVYTYMIEGRRTPDCGGVQIYKANIGGGPDPSRWVGWYYLGCAQYPNPDEGLPTGPVTPVTPIDPPGVPPASGSGSISVSQGSQYGCSGCSRLDVAVHGFRTGTYLYQCHDNSGVGGADATFVSGSVTVTDPNQSAWPGAFCFDSPPYTVYLAMGGVRSSSVTFQSSPTPPVTPPPTTPPPTQQTWREQETPNHAVSTFTNYHNASGVGPQIAAGQWVDVSCKVLDGTIASVNPDGYWYRIASSPWNNAYYSPANTFMNGDPYGGPYSHNTDYAVPNC